MKEITTGLLSESNAQPEQFDTADDLSAFLPPGWPASCPLARIRTCGTLSVEVLIELRPGPDGQPQAVYGPPAASLLEIKGMTTAFLLLALLASQPQCVAARDFLVQTLPHAHRTASFEEEDDLGGDGAFKRLDNVVSLLRTLLTPPVLLPFPGVHKVRKRLVRYVRATAESGPGYALAPFPWLWLDVEAMETCVRRARQVEARGQDGLEDWQAVYQIGMRGPFLGHEPYSEWADWRRGRVAELLWQSVRAQCQRAIRWEGSADGREAAARLLLDYWQSHVTNEDAFAALIEVLGKQERFHLAEECYRQLGAALDREGRLPQKRTQETMAGLRLMRDRHEDDTPKPLSLSSQAWVVEGKVVPLEGQTDLPAPTASSKEAGQFLPETRHLIGRQTWLAGISQMVHAFPAKKLLILQGPVGVGKSSELARLAQHFQQASSRVIWVPLPAAEWSTGPGAALDVLLGTLMSECGLAPFPAEAPRERRISAVVAHLKQSSRPTVILLDNAECLLEEDGKLSACWESFLMQFVRSRHQASMLLASKEWHGWPGRESIFVAETFVPPLSQEESVCLLQRLGLHEVPIDQLQAASLRLLGIPLLLEWTARLVADPLLLDQWEHFPVPDAILEPYTTQESLTRRLQTLLDDPALLGERLANQLAPLLQRIVDKHLSDEARQVLARLSIAVVPLGKPALQRLCPRPLLLKELRDASLLAAYSHRVQVLPIVALTVQQRLSPTQRREIETLVIQAYTCWLDEGKMDLREAGSVVTELAVLLLSHQRLVEAAELLIRLGWLSFQCGYGSRLARLSQEVLHQMQWHQSIEDECVGLALIHTVFPFLGKPLCLQEHADYPRLRNAFLAGELPLSPTIEGNITHLLLLDAMESLQFEQGQAILDAYCGYLQARQIKHPKQQTKLILEQGLLLGIWCEYLLEQQKTEQAFIMREQTIALYRQCVTRFATLKTSSPVTESMRKNGLAYASAYLGYHLNQIGQHEEALQMIDQAIHFHEQGYGYTSILADSYSEKAQTLMALGRFQEAFRFDEQAMREIHRWAREGDVLSQGNVWTYQVNRGRLYLRLGRMEDAERLLQEAEPRLPRLRRNYRMFAKDALEEIAQWRQQTGGVRQQLDWRWVDRFRALTAYDSYWWLTWAGPFTEEEQQEWDRLFALPLDEITKVQLGALMTTSRERELEASLAEQREPRLHYPAIEIEEIRRRIAAQERLDADIAQQEPNAIVKKLYREAIAEELDYLHLIEATYECNTEQFWECAQRLHPLPSKDEMIDALGYVQALIEQGLASPAPAAVQATRQFQEYLFTRIQLPPDLLAEAAAPERKPPIPASTSSSSECSLSAEAAQRFFTTVLEESGYEGWQVVLDPHGGMARVERGARALFLPDKRYNLAEIRHLFVHELAGHVGYCIAGEQSPLGLLGLQMKNSGPTQEGLALYHERQVLALRGESLSDNGMRIGMLSVGLAAGVVTPPQTFSKLCAFLERLTLLRYVVRNPQPEHSEAQRQAARRYALSICLRVYRGVPDLEQAGVCYLQDVMHLRGLQLIERAVAADAGILDRLSVGVCALEHLPDLQELEILSMSQPLLRLAYATDLNEYICSFETSAEKGGM